MLHAAGMHDDVAIAGADHLIGLRHAALHSRRNSGPVTGMPGGFVGRRRGRGLEPDDIRAYVPGDDIRHIDRNATARHGTPQVRQYREERDRTVLLVADFRAAMLWGTKRVLRLAAAAEALAIKGWMACAAGARVGLYAFGPETPTYIPPRARERGMIDVIGGLVAAQRNAFAAASSDDLATALEAAFRWLPTGGTAILASSLDKPGSSFAPLTASLGRRSRFEILLICDTFEIAPPPGLYPYRAGERTDIAVIGDKARRAGLDERLALCESADVPVAVIDSGAGTEAMAREIGRHDG
jgi:uncharacterized protein (DUF58 family)